MQQLFNALHCQFEEAAKLEKVIRKNLRALAIGGAE